MTNKIYLTKRLSPLGIDEDYIDILLLKANLEPDVLADFQQCDFAIYKNFSIVLSNSSQNITEGGYSISWNMSAVRMLYDVLCKELGVNNVTRRNKVRNKSNLW